MRGNKSNFNTKIYSMPYRCPTDAEGNYSIVLLELPVTKFGNLQLLVTSQANE